ncbi:chaplin [Streptomyces sp. NBC_00234]|uniref:chaplin n=1 Tax=Streptomyces sp. NBC_00234 TaxID=2903638 RepID=UPI002E2C3D06|nr:chaplin family protein [Streptomyces sp. NBC_00234]
MIVMAAASGILSAAGGYAHADSSADGAAIGSPGVGSGNAVQAPVHIPVNLCGNTVDVIALLNPAFGNTCANVDSGKGKGKGNGAHQSGASAEGAATHSPGVLSGNLIQAPVQVPVNACGNTVDVVGALNPAGGNTCANVSGPDHKPPTEPPTEEPPTGKPPVKEPPAHQPPQEPPANEPPAYAPPAEQTPVDHGPHRAGSQLAQTGSAGVGLAAGASAVLMLGGAVLLRRTRGSQG